MIQLDLKKISDYLLVFFLTAVSGIPFFLRSGIPMLFITTTFAGCIYVYRKQKVHTFLAHFVIFYILIQFGQTVKFDYFPIKTFIGFYLRLALAYFTIALVKDKFTEYYVNVLVFLTLFGLVFFIPCFISRGFESFLINNFSQYFRTPFFDPAEDHYIYHPDLLLYVFNDGESVFNRNSGPFWEPGANAGFLVMAILFHIIRSHTLLDKTGKILMIGLVSTFSTTGILVLMVIVTSFIMADKSPAFKAIVVPVMLIGGIIAFNTVDFLGEKIENTMDYSNAGYNTRFGSAVLDVTDALENPLVGLGRNSQTRFKGETDPVKTHRNNGVTDYLAAYGFVAFIFYFGLIYFSYRRLCEYYNFNKSFALYCILMILLIGFSEGYFTKPFFYGLTLLHLGFNLDKLKKGETMKPVRLADVFRNKNSNYVES